MAKYLFIITFLGFTCVINANTSRFTDVMLSDSARITILTCGPGNELYSLFGHSAIRVSDRMNNIDLVFNYGTFDFTTTNFYLKFAKGELDYCLSAYPYRYFPISYIDENRWIDEQLLNLDSKSLNALFHSLIVNLQESNRYYRYDFFFDNCATRIRNILVENILPLQTPTDSLVYGSTFRDQMNIYLKPHPWTHLGLNLALGSKCDDVMTNWSFTYLPDNLSNFISHCTIKHNDSTLNQSSLTSSKQRVINANITSHNLPFFTPIYLIFILIVLSLFSYFINLNFYIVKIFEILLFSVVGIAGLIIYFLTFVSSHSICSINYNCLVVTPLFLIYLFSNRFVIINKLQSLVTFSLLSCMIIFAVIAISNLQTFTLEIYLLVFLLLTRLVQKVSYLNTYLLKLKKPQ